MKYIIANWKAHKTLDEANEWMAQFVKNDFSEIKDEFKIIIAAPFHTLESVKRVTDQYTFMQVASQDISQFEIGAYTGEVCAQMLYGLVEYSVIGHSERRKLFNESNEMIHQKAKYAKTFGIEPIVCVRSNEDTIPAHTKIVVYEELSSIGNGNNESIENVLNMQKSIDPQNKYSFLYGGSVNEDNVADYISHDSIAGVCIGTASINPQEFYATIKAALL
ncbi:MAG: triose-phosphate isomerase family protein [Microgenomates group bacterium]